MAKFAVLTVGRSGVGWANEAVADYRKRLRRFGGVEEISVPTTPFRGDIQAVRVGEAKALLKRITPRDRLITLDERGRSLSTEQFTQLIEGSRNEGVHRLAFAIGGAYGHDASVRQAAHRVVRLSSLVLNHEVARVVLYEQLYRAMAILNRIPYHH